MPEAATEAVLDLTNTNSIYRQIQQNSIMDFQRKKASAGLKQTPWKYVCIHITGFVQHVSMAFFKKNTPHISSSFSDLIISFCKHQMKLIYPLTEMNWYICQNQNKVIVISISTDKERAPQVRCRTKS